VSQDAESEQDKSEEASPFKLARARREGTVARGIDLSFLTAVFCGGALVWLGGTFLATRLAEVSRRAFISAASVDASPGAILAVTASTLMGALVPVTVGALVLFGVMGLMELAQTGPVFSAKAIRLDFSRLNPAQNFKRVFSRRVLVETVKSVLKLAAYVALAWAVYRFAEAMLAPTISGAASLADALRRAGLRLMFFFAAGAAAFAILDQIVVRRDFARRMRMSRRDMRREMKDREGDPRLKQRRKSLHAEFVKQSQSLRGVRGADLMIVNPTHFAVALRYDPATMVAPRVVARGAHQFAQRL
jgi:flagellar biosynthesis protein FlhB